MHGKPGKPASGHLKRAGKPVNAVQVALIFFAVVCLAGISLVCWFLIARPVIASFGKQVFLPSARSIDEDRFLGNFRDWFVLSDFQVSPPASNELGASSWKFSMNCETGGQGHLGDKLWYLEVFAAGQLVHVAQLRAELVNPDPDQPVTQKTVFRMEAECAVPTYQFAEPPDQFFTYIGGRNSMMTRVPVSGILEAGGSRTSETPVVYGTNFRKTRDMIRLANPGLRLGEIHAPEDDALTLEFDVLDDSFFLDFQQDSRSQDDYTVYLNVENQFGAVMKFHGPSLFDKDQGEITITGSMRPFIDSEMNHFKRKPLRVYITREQRQQHARSSVLNPVDLFSNELVVE